jgi:hypothetical protein
MNQRISELARQSGTWEYYEINEGVGEDEKHLEKFALLIIRECAQSVNDWYQNHDRIQADPGSWVLAHFGVEA